MKQNKTYDLISSKTIYENYLKTLNKQEFITDFIESEKSNGITSPEDFFCLLLIESIRANDKALLQEIFKINEKSSYPALLLNVNEHHQSAMTAVLVYDEEGEIKSILKKILNIDFRFPKLCLTKEAFFKLHSCVGFLGEYYTEDIDLLLKPILDSWEVDRLKEPRKFENP